MSIELGAVSLRSGDGSKTAGRIPWRLYQVIARDNRRQPSFMINRIITPI